MEEHITQRDAIINIQTYLRKLGYTGYGNIPVPIDGIFESVTEEAVIAFQRANGILPTGRVNKTTWDILYTLYSERIEDELEARGVFPFPDTPENYEVTVGSRSALVAVIQILLDELESKYDELTDTYGCNLNLDEDDMVDFLGGRTRECPYYRYYDEYKSVHKQI